MTYASRFMKEMRAQTEKLRGLKMKHVVAQFNTNTRYYYLIPEGDQPKVGDLIVTSVSEEIHCTETGSRPVAVDAKVARIVEVNEGCMPPAHKANQRFYLWLIPATQMKERHTANAAFLERARLREEARQRLDRMLAKRDRMQDYERMAIDDPEARRLLAIVKDES